MSSALAPRRFLRLLASDAQNVGRDPILFVALTISVLPVILVYLFAAQIEAGGVAIGLAGLARIAGAFALVLPAFLVGWVTGFLLLEDRDDGPLMAMEITPIGKGGFLLYRTSVTAAISFLIGLISFGAIFPSVSPGLALLLSAMLATEAVTFAFLLLALAGNKVEGLALSKLLNFASIAPFLAALPWAWRYAGGVIPSFWIGETLQLSPGDSLPLPAVLLAGVAMHGVWAAGALWMALRRIG
jgi:hypothetical protein